MIRRGEQISHAQDTAHREEELGGKLLAVVGYDVTRWTIYEHPSLEKGLGDCIRREGPERDSYSHLGEPVSDEEDIFVTLSGLAKWARLSITMSSRGAVTGNSFEKDECRRYLTGSRAQVTLFRAAL